MSLRSRHALERVRSHIPGLLKEDPMGLRMASKVQTRSLYATKCLEMFLKCLRETDQTGLWLGRCFFTQSILITSSARLMSALDEWVLHRIRRTILQRRQSSYTLIWERQILNHETTRFYSEQLLTIRDPFNCRSQNITLVVEITRQTKGWSRGNQRSMQCSSSSFGMFQISLGTPPFWKKEGIFQ